MKRTPGQDMTRQELDEQDMENVVQKKKKVEE